MTLPASPAANAPSSGLQPTPRRLLAEERLETERSVSVVETPRRVTPVSLEAATRLYQAVLQGQRPQVELPRRPTPCRGAGVAQLPPKA